MACRTKELHENDTYLEMFASLCSKVESEFALKASSGNSGFAFCFVEERSAQDTSVVAETPVLHLLRRTEEASTGSELKTPQTCETVALPATSTLPRRRSLYDAARRHGVSSVFTSGRWEGGSIAAHAFLPLPPSRRLSSGSNLVVPNHKSIGGAAASATASTATAARQANPKR